MKGVLKVLGLGTVLTLGLIAFSQAGAQEQEPQAVQIQVSENEEHGAYLTDAEGMSLYLFLNDRDAEPYQEPHLSTCYDQCAENWPPFIVEVWPPPEGAEAFVGEGVDETLLTAIARDDGTLQLAYGNWPLYYFARDEAPGDTAGQGVGEVWYLVSPAGEIVGYEPGMVDDEAEDMEDDAEEDMEDDEGNDNGN